MPRVITHTGGMLALLFALQLHAAAPKQTVLFLCTGNFYRSRLAEAVFNHEAARAGLRWRAESAGLKTSLLSAEERRQRISPLTKAKLAELGVPLNLTSADPRPATAALLTHADCVVAMSEREHRPYLEADFNTLKHLPLVYWENEDVEVESSDKVLPKIVENVRALVRDLKAGHPPAPCAARRER